jgi:thioredoxin 2
VTTSATSTGAPTVLTCPHCGKKNRVPAVAPGAPRCGNCHNPLPWVVNADDSSFHDVVETASLPVLVDLWAPWCGPCRMVTPILEQLAAEFAGRIKLVKVNADESPATSQRFAVMGIPTLLLLSQGEERARQVGAAPADVLRKWLDSSLQERP